MQKIELTDKEKSKLFWASFVALAAAAIGFGLRVMIVRGWSKEFSITAAEAGAIAGAALWPIAISMIVFSLIVDKIGYKISMIIAFALQTISVIMTIFTPSGESQGAADYLWWACFLSGLGHGVIEAVINPLCATMYRKEKSKMLNILHASWPAGIVIGGSLFLLFGSYDLWRIFFIIMLVPVIVYGAIFFMAKRYPIDERVEAGIGYGEMIKEFGGLGTFIAATFLTYEIFGQLGVKFENGNNLIYSLIIGAIIGLIVGFIIKSRGKWLFFILCLIMIPLAAAELATDGWIRTLMEPVLGSADAAGWAIVLSALIMMTLRFFAGVPLKFLSAPGLLLLSSCFSIVGLFALSGATGVGIFIAFVLYAVGQTFYWPTVLGFVSEQFPKGGAMTLNTVTAMGLLTVGIFGFPFLGAVKDSYDAKTIHEHHPELYKKYSKEKVFFAVPYNSIKIDEVIADTSLNEEKKEFLNTNDQSARKTIRTATILPVIMAIAFLLIILYYKSIGGYKPVQLTSEKD